MAVRRRNHIDTYHRDLAVPEPIVDAELVPEGIDAIIQHEKEADRLTGVQEAAGAEADTHRREAARGISEQLDAGMSQRKLAAEIGKSKSHVLYMAKSWELHESGHLSDHLPFNEVYNSAEVRGEITDGPDVPSITAPDSNDPDSTPADSPAGKNAPRGEYTADGKYVPVPGKPPTRGKKPKTTEHRSETYEIKTPYANPHVICLRCKAVWHHECDQSEDAES